MRLNVGSEALARPSPEVPIAMPATSSPATIGMFHEARSAAIGPRRPTSTTSARVEKLTGSR